MNDRNQTTQLVLFEARQSNWNSLPREVQQSILDVVSRMFSNALDGYRSDHITTTSTTEDRDVS